MNGWIYILRSLRFHRWIHLSVLLAIGTATGVFTGALIIGDSVSDSLKKLGLGRLGNIDSILISDRFFGIERYEELTRDKAFRRITQASAPLCVSLHNTVECRSSGQNASGPTDSLQRATDVLLLAIDARFWNLGKGMSAKVPGDGQVIINQALARDCGARVGDQLTIRLPGAHPVPADSPLGRKDNRVRSLIGLEVIEILPNEGLGDFTIHPVQQSARNAWVSIGAFSDAVDRPDHINAIFVQSKTGGTSGLVGDGAVASPDQVQQEMDQRNRQLRPELSDFGISLERQTRAFDGKTIWDYWNITSDRLVWDETARDVVDALLVSDMPQEVFTYLANSISVVKGGDGGAATPETSVAIPYSTVSALDNHRQLGPLVNAKGKVIAPLQDDEIALNTWATERLQCAVGDTIRITYFAPETLHGKAEERHADFKLAAIVPIATPENTFRRDRPPTFASPPTLANDPALTPTVQGVTDQATIRDWDPPFPFDQDRIEAHDEVYWDQHRATPKAFVSLAAGRKLWTSRLGTTTAFRVPAVQGVDESLLSRFLTNALRRHQTELGFQFQPLRVQVTRASAGTTPFAYLFLGFSMFLVGSALMLIATLFRLGLDLRATEFGTLAAHGVSIAKIRRMSLCESAWVAGGGALIGVVAGIVYASIMLFGLRTWWKDAIVTPFVHLHLHGNSLLTGWGLSVLVALWVVWRGLGRMAQAPVRELLAGRFSDATRPQRLSTELTDRAAGGDAGQAIDDGSVRQRMGAHWRRYGLKGLLVIAAFLGLIGTLCSGETQSGLFFCSGALVLIVLIVGVGRQMDRSAASDRAVSLARRVRISPLQLAWKNAIRYPRRSQLTIGLMAAACFLILAIAAFRMAPTEAGTGGYALIAHSDQPIFDDLNLDATRKELFGDKAVLLKDTTIRRLRRRTGDDASCRNLYQSSQPQLLGIPDEMIAQTDQAPDQFAWSKTTTRKANSWRCLAEENDQPTEIPVVLDRNTALYALHLPARLGHRFTMKYDGHEKPLTFRIVGILNGTMLQGNLIVHERDLLRAFPETSGYRSFLVQTPTRAPEALAKISTLLEARFGDQGLDIEQSDDVLHELLAVQNTYLSTFQSLGTLGLLLGAVGLVAVQIRQVLSRRGELALLSAMGMTPRWICAQLVRENAVLLGLGLAIGLAAAMIVLIPHQLSGAAHFPFGTLVITLGGIFTLGLAAGFAAAHWITRQPLVKSLRGDQDSVVSW